MCVHSVQCFRKLQLLLSFRIPGSQAVIFTLLFLSSPFFACKWSFVTRRYTWENDSCGMYVHASQKWKADVS